MSTCAASTAQAVRRHLGGDPFAQRRVAFARRVLQRLARRCRAGRGSVASRIASTGKVSGDGRPPASEMIPGQLGELQDLADHRRVHPRGARRQAPGGTAVHRGPRLEARRPVAEVAATAQRRRRRRPTGIARPTNTVATTASAKRDASPRRAARRAPARRTASTRNGCTSCTWLTRTVPPSARPRYQAKKPSHIENTVT